MGLKPKISVAEYLTDERESPVRYEYVLGQVYAMAGGDAYYRSQPVVIVEVLSPTTERIDRNEKLAAYRRVPTLREYVLLSQDGLAAEFHHRTAEGEWTCVRLDQPEEELLFASIGLTMTLADVYRNVRFPETDTPATFY